MRCETVRVVLSARLDGEAETAEPVVDAHLAGCADCRGWLGEAERVTRLVRVQAVRVPDLTARILAAARTANALPGPAPRQPSRVYALLRWGLGLLATVQLLLAAPELLVAGAGGLGHAAHAGREVAAFDVALAVGLLIAACYPEQARYFVPVVTTLVGCLVTISAVDMAQGVVTPGRVAIHALAVGQAVLLWLLARRVNPRLAVAR
jgi:predicted anti-sigma-YlaC factor YlaD